MKKYSCYIIDDEPLAMNVLVQHVSRFPEMEIVGKTTEPLEARVQVRQLQPDLLFVDIEMPELSGLELIASLSHTPEIIITTAYRDYAVEGFTMNVLDYLVKPVSFQRFAMAMDKFFEQKNSLPKLESYLQPDFIQIRADRKFLRIPFDQILYIEGLKDYVRIVTTTDKVMTKVSIGHMLELLPPDRFLQVHKSFVIAKAKITAFTAQDVMIGTIEIPIGRSYKDEVMKALGG